MASSTRRRLAARSKTPKHYEIIEGEVMFDEEDGVVVWVTPPDDRAEVTPFGVSAGGVIGKRLFGRRVRITVEEI